LCDQKTIINEVIAQYVHKPYNHSSMKKKKLRAG